MNNSEDYRSLRPRNSLLERADYNGQIGEIKIADVDWVFIQGSTFRSLTVEIINLVGTGGITVLFEAGKKAGRNFSQKILKEGIPPEEVPMWLEVFFTEGGWGKIKAQADFANKTALVVIDNCATARLVKSEEPTCHFIRGYLSGICETLFKTNVECIETKCMSKGNACCEFHAQSKR